MKLFGSNHGSHANHSGNSSSGSHRPSPQQSASQYNVQQAKEYEYRMREKQMADERSEMRHRVAGRKRKQKTWVKVLIIVLAVLLAIAAAGVIWWKVSVKPPEITKSKGTKSVKIIDDSREEEPNISVEKKTKDEDPGEEPDERSGEKYTFLVLGCDDGNGNTDTIMAVTFDTDAYTLDVVSIPRDTLVNVKWSTKKANTLFYAYKEDGIKTAFADLLGYEVDFYCIVDLDAFIVLIDDIGGVDYDVPISMNYDDPYQDLHIHVSKGMQHLSGKEAMGVVRYRKGYANADIGRIGTQQDFMMTVAKQILANKDSLSVSTLADVFVKYVKTDLTAGNIVWLAKEFFKMNMDNIRFHTIPANYNDSVNGESYVTIYVNDWLKMINTYLNPFDNDIVSGDLDILTRNSSGALYATSGVRKGDAGWGTGGSKKKTSANGEDENIDENEEELIDPETGDPLEDPNAVIEAENGEDENGESENIEPREPVVERIEDGEVVVGDNENPDDYHGV